MSRSIAEFALSAAAILLAGSILTSCADLIAQESGLGRMLVGSVFLAMATSLPELSVDLDSVGLGACDLAAGDLLGSSLMNLLILALLDSSGISPKRAFGRDSRHHALTALLAMLLTAWIGLAAESGGGPQILGAGLFSWTALLIYAGGLRLVWLEQDGPRPAEKPRRARSEIARALAKPVAGYAAAAGVIFIAAPHVASSAKRISEFSGLGQTFIGTTVLALATSLPELVSSFFALRMGAADLALGNIFGSNSLNMVLFLPLDLASPSPFFGSIGRDHAMTAFAVIAASTLAVMGQVAKPRQRRWFLEPSAEVVALFLAVLLWLLYRKGTAATP